MNRIWLNTFLIGVALVYPIYTVGKILIQGFGPDPVADWMQGTGQGALIFLFLSLGGGLFRNRVSPGPLKAFRRTTGLLSFSYATVHAIVFFWVDYGLDPFALKEAVLEKPFALAGLTAYLMLIPLAVTSTKGWIRRLGKSWKKLHAMVYGIGGMALIHYFWLVKSDYRIPLGWLVLYGMILLRRFLFHSNVSKKSRKMSREVVHR